MLNLEILKSVCSFAPGDVITDADVHLVGGKPEDWIAVHAAKRTDKECSKGIDPFRVPGSRENAERVNPKAVKAFDDRLVGAAVATK